MSSRVRSFHSLGIGQHSSTTMEPIVVTPTKRRSSSSRPRLLKQRLRRPSTSRKCVEFAFINGVWVCTKTGPEVDPGASTGDPGLAETYEPVR